VVVALMPAVAVRAAEKIRRSPGPSIGLGFAWAILVPILAVGFAATVIGIPLALVLAAVYAVALYLGRAVVAVWLARVVLGNRLGTGRGDAVLGFLAGAVVLVLLRLVPVIGGLVTIVASVLGVGAVLALLRERRARREGTVGVP
jgi:hypothetical protein